MAGGTFKLSQPKVRPGAYVNVINGRQPVASNSPVGIAVIPLIGYDYGPREEWIHLYAGSPDAAKTKLGRSIFDETSEFMRMIQLMFLNATEVYVYICGGGKAATGNMTVSSGTATVTAKYPGTLGNNIQIVSVANPEDGFDVSVLLNGSEVEFFEGKKTVGDLESSEYIKITSGDVAKQLTNFASLKLSGGTDDPEKTNSSVSKFLDSSEKIKFNAMAFPTTEASLITAAITKIKYIRNTIGWKCHLIVVKTAADHEGVYNLTNAFEIYGKELSIKESSAWLAGAVAAADYVTSLTYKIVVGATAVVGEMNNEAAIEAIKKGETFFSVNDNGDVILEYDVNSKVTFTQDDPVDINKGRPCRVYDTLANELLTTFIPGKFNNDADGWAVMEGLGRAILKAYADDGAITNVNVEEDFVVDTGASAGDSVYINVGVQPVDSAEKYYFSVVAK